jgi:phage terminase large subunit
MNPSDNKEYIPPTYYKRMSSTDQPEAWRKRFFLGEYAENLEGAVFKEELKDLDQQGRETEIPFVKSEPITAVLDIGQTTACWLAYINVLKERVELIDYIEAYGVSVKWMLDKIKFLGYRLGLVVLPHDASPASHQTGTSVVEEYRSYAQKMGFEVSILPKSKWGDNINALRKWFPRFWFNASSTSVGMDAIRNYEYSGFASSSGNVDNVKPRHNWASHAADALKYVALWCGRDYDFLKTSATPISKYGVHSDIRYIKNAEWKKKEDEHWIIENLIEEWRRIRDEDYW